MIIYNNDIGHYEDKGNVKRKALIKDKPLSLNEVYLKKGGTEKIHSHDKTQISYIVKGTVNFNLDGKIYKVSRGDSMYVSPGIKHGVEALEESIIVCVR